MMPVLRSVSAMLSTLESNISRSIASLLCSFRSCSLSLVMSRAIVTMRSSPPSSTTTDESSVGISTPLLVRNVTKPHKFVIYIDEATFEVGDRQRVQDRVENFAQAGLALFESLFRSEEVGDVACDRQAAQLAVQLNHCPGHEARNDGSIL